MTVSSPAVNAAWSPVRPQPPRIPPAGTRAYVVMSSQSPRSRSSAEASTFQVTESAVYVEPSVSISAALIRATCVPSSMMRTSITRHLEVPESTRQRRVVAGVSMAVRFDDAEPTVTHAACASEPELSERVASSSSTPPSASNSTASAIRLPSPAARPIAVE